MTEQLSLTLFIVKEIQFILRRERLRFSFNPLVRNGNDTLYTLNGNKKQQPVV